MASTPPIVEAADRLECKLWSGSTTSMQQPSAHEVAEGICYDTLLAQTPAAMRTCQAAFSPSGLGLLIVSDAPVPAGALDTALNATRALALSPNDVTRRGALTRGLQSDVRSSGLRNTTTFTLPFKYCATDGGDLSVVPRCALDDPSVADAVDGVGAAMANVGRLVAKLCDSMLGLHGALERAVLRSGNAKARLVHYHASDGPSPSDSVSIASLGTWQGWHCDYGLFTVLCSPRYDDDSVDKGVAPVTVLPPPSAGLVLLPRRSDVGTGRGISPVHVHIPPGAFAVQVGEAAQVLTGGRLTAVPHCVARPAALQAGGSRVCVSRTTLILFLQPPWEMPLLPVPTAEPWYPSDETKAAAAAASGHALSEGARRPVAGELAAVEVLRASEDACGPLGDDLLPPLRGRWACGMSYAEFSQRTTRAYYGGSGGSSVRSAGSGGSGRHQRR